jgi:very-short-patch-repair endonuclease
LKPLARELRINPTEAEQLLWQRLRKNQLFVKFRRQHAIERFIVDFYCHEFSLIIEIDGDIHQYQKEEDNLRQEFLEASGFKVIRFSNDEVMKNIDEVIEKIKRELTPPLPLPASREG